jgi:biopolymer transport protein TolQ
MGLVGIPVFYQVSGSITELIANAGMLAKTILVILLVLSVVSWTIIVEKIRYFRRQVKQSSAFRSVYEQQRSLAALIDEAGKYPDSPEAFIVRRVASEMEHNDLKRRDHVDGYLDSAIESLVSLWESYLMFLSTTATVSPFLGLLGTVWGIMSSFLSMGVRGSASLYVVAPGIADALITTVFGLGAAIPAVIGYNYILRIIRRREEEAISFSVRFRTRLLEKRYDELADGMTGMESSTRGEPVPY